MTDEAARYAAAAWAIHALLPRSARAARTLAFVAGAAWQRAQMEPLIEQFQYDAQMERANSEYFQEHAAQVEARGKALEPILDFMDWGPEHSPGCSGAYRPDLCKCGLPGALAAMPALRALLAEPADEATPNV